MPIQLTVPTTWNELSERQLKNIVFQLDCYYQIIKHNASVTAKASTKLFTQIVKELLKSNNLRDINKALQEVHPNEFVPLSKFIYNKVERTKFIASVSVNGVTYYGPGQRLRNTIIAEFSFADVAFYKWKQTNQLIWLNVLCATLYRERANQPSQIDKRTPFQKLAVDSRTDKFEKLNYKTKLAIAYTYEGSRNHIAATFKNIFPTPVETEETPVIPIKKPKYVSFGEIILDKIAGDPYKLETTNNVLTYDFLAIYNKDIADMRKK